MIVKKRDPTATKALAKFCQTYAKGGERQLKAMGASEGTSGGFLVPPELRLNIDGFLTECGVFHRYAQRFDMKSSELNVSGVDMSWINETTATPPVQSPLTGQSPSFGGLLMAWKREGQLTTFTKEPKFAQTKFVAVDMLGGIINVPNPMMDDGGEVLGEYIEKMFALALEWHVEKACLTGYGIPSAADAAAGGGAQPVGVVNAQSTKVVTRSGGGAIVAADVNGLVNGLFPGSFDRAIWVCNQTVIPKLDVITGYQVASGCCSVDPAAPNRLAGWLLNRPVFATEKCPVVGTKGDLVLFDPLLYGLATRQLEISYSRHYQFASNMTTFLVVWRGDGQSLVKSTATLQDNSTVVGAAAVLTT